MFTIVLFMINNALYYFGVAMNLFAMLYSMYSQTLINSVRPMHLILTALLEKPLFSLRARNVEIRSNLNFGDNGEMGDGV